MFMKRNDIVFVLKVSFYIYAVFYWLEFALIGRQLMSLEKVGEAVQILQTSNLFLVDLIRVIISHKKAWMFIIPEILKIISLPYVVLVYLWFYIEDNIISRHLMIIWSMSLFVLLGVTIVLSQQSLGKGLNMTHILGTVVLVASLSMEVLVLIRFLKERKRISKFND